MICFFGHKYGEVKDAYQYCQKCGVARVAPCAHIWINTYEIGIFNITYGEEKYRVGTKYVDVCRKCGERKILKS